MSTIKEAFEYMDRQSKRAEGEISALFLNLCLQEDMNKKKKQYTLNIALWQILSICLTQNKNVRQNVRHFEVLEMA